MPLLIQLSFFLFNQTSSTFPYPPKDGGPDCGLIGKFNLGSNAAIQLSVVEQQSRKKQGVRAAFWIGAGC